MPATISHLLFAEQVFNKLDSREIKKIIHKNNSFFLLGALGPDIFFFKGYTNYKIRLYRRAEGGRPIILTEMALRVHKEYIREFIESFYEYVLNQKQGENKKNYERILCYYLGYLTHYELDKNIHSYVSSTEKDLMGRVRSAKWDFVHMKIESNLDAALLENYKHKNPVEYKINDFLNLEKERCKVVAKAYRFIFFNLWGISVPSDHIADTFLDAKKGFATLYKKLVNRKKESRIVRRVIGLRSLYFVVTPKKMEDDFDYCNLEKRPWKIPSTANDEESNETIFELFERTGDETIKFIDDIYDALMKNSSPDFKTFINRAYNGEILP